MGLHVGIIPDGNRRWAREHHLKPWQGHEHGYKTFLRILTSLPAEIDMLTMYALSRENLQRSREELAILYALFERAIIALPRVLQEHGMKREDIRITFPGQHQYLPDTLQRAFQRVERENPAHPRLTLNLLVVYNGQDEIAHAVNTLLTKHTSKGETLPSEEQITREVIEKALWISRPADIIIRTGMTDGQRLSGFLLWQSSYAEFYFLKKYWPDFTPEDLREIIKDFSHQRVRRFGT